jgi:fucose permease
MTGKRFALAIGCALLCAAGQAKAASYDTFNIDFFATADGASFWESNAVFTVTSNSSDESTSGFTQNSFCPDDNYWECVCDPGLS